MLLPFIQKFDGETDSLKSLSSDIRSELIRRLKSDTWFNLVNLIIVGGVVSMTHQSEPSGVHRFVIGYGVAALMIIIAHFFRHSYLFRHARQTPTARWQRVFDITVVLSATAWGSLCALAFHNLGLSSFTTFIIVLCASQIAANATFALAPMRSRTLLFNFNLFMLPLTYLAFRGGGEAFTAAAVLTTYLLLLAGQSVRLGRDFLAELVNQQQLLEDKKQLEAVTRAKADFLANISDELRNPLNTIVGESTVLADSSLTEAQRHSVETIRSCNDNLLNIVTDLMDFSKIESGRMDIVAEKLSLHQVVNDARSLIVFKASEKGLFVEAKLDSSIPSLIISDSGRISQILINLMSNAAKFTDNGGISVFISATPKAQGLHEILFQVKDTGIGIPPERQKNLFQPFNRIDAYKSRKQGGTGLGLAICATLAKLMGGRIWVESEIGKGSNFCFTILVEEATAEQVTSPKPIILPKPTRHAQNQNKTDGGTIVKLPAQESAESYGLSVLAVDDNPTNLYVATKILEKFGCEAEQASDGLSALQAIKQKNFDLVLMDVQMPGLSGIDTTREIRQLGHSITQPRIAALTANALEEEKKRCFDAGMDDFLTKPVRMDELKKILRKVQDSKKAAA